jgi:ABC-2 type transport system ATP-binding protein
VTGFLGPNGAGKSTTMRMILGLDRPTAGEVRIGRKRYVDLTDPMRHVGALLDAKWVHPNRSARAHLRWLAAANRLPERRVDEVLDIVGLTDVAHRRAGGFSLGMAQRLGIAGALLGDPGVMLFDEPVNGLDPEGILWIRRLMRRLADEGRTVFVSSHLLSEMAVTASDLVVIGRGRLIAQTTTAAFTDQASGATVRVRGPEPHRLLAVLTAGGLAVNEVPASDAGPAAFTVHDVTTEAVGDLAGAAGLVLHELAAQRGSLEEAFLRLTGQDVEYRAGDRPGQPAGSNATARAGTEGNATPSGYPAAAAYPETTNSPETTGSRETTGYSEPAGGVVWEAETSWPA